MLYDNATNGDTTLKETIQSQPAETVTDKRSGPKGIGMAVAFDWGLTVQLLLMPILTIFLGSPALSRRVNMTPGSSIITAFLISWPIAALFVLFGEGVRRGWRWTRPIQIAGNTLGFLGGFVLLPQVWQGIKGENYWTLVPAIILLVFSPLIAWRLSRPETARWFATVTSTEARKRHGGSWIWKIALWSIVGGSLVALGAFH
jgi:hypothetical protein